MKRFLTFLAVLVAILFLAAVIVPTFMPHGSSKFTKAKMQIAVFAHALDVFRADCGRYPTSTEGLDALIQRPVALPTNLNWHRYLDATQAPKDPWGHEYVYQYPGTHNPATFDVYSVGVSGPDPAGEIGNWKPPEDTVILYTSQDEVYAEPIIKDFEKQTGIQVKPVFDSEAVKTVGLVNRLLQEASNPQCDVFWNNEEFRTRQLASHGVFRETNGWARLGYRSRRIVVNTNLVKLSDAPREWTDVTNKIWRNKVALAYPLFGTTSTHFQAWRQLWGDDAWQSWCRALLANDPKIVDGNSVVVKQVARGEAVIGFADSDDIADAQQEGSPVVALPLTRLSLVLPNTVGVIKNCPHPDAAQKLFDYLQEKQVSQGLVNAHALEGASYDPATAVGLSVNWDQLLHDLQPATDEATKIFLRSGGQGNQ